MRLPLYKYSEKYNFIGEKVKDLVSVVVPIYNVEKYLKKCVETIINQTYKNIEIILVNDGSTDNCLCICNEFRNKDKRINVIDKKNGGLSDARNVGLKNAHGKYICFIDSDDYIAETYIETLYGLIVKNNAQIAMCNYENVDENGRKISKHKAKEQIISGKYAIEILNDIVYCSPYIVAWNKLYDINLFKNITFPVGKIHEDVFTIYKLFYLSKTVAVTSQSLYFYREVPTSIMHKKFNKKRLDVIEGLEERIVYFAENKEEKLHELALIKYEKMLLLCYVKCRKYIENSKKIQNELLEKFKKNYNNVICSKYCSRFDKLRIRMAYISPTLYYYMFFVAKAILRKK